MPYIPSERFTVTTFLKNLRPVKDIPETLEFFIKSKNKSEKITFRKAKSTDLKPVSELDLEFTKAQYQNYDKTLNLNWTYSQYGQKYFKKRMSNHDGTLKVAVNEQGKIIAYLSGGAVKSHPLSIKAHYAELENVFIKDDYRGSGVGEKMVNDFIVWCKKNKIDFIDLAVAYGSGKVIDFYKKLGFKETYATMEMDLRTPAEKKTTK